MVRRAVASRGLAAGLLALAVTAFCPSAAPAKAAPPAPAPAEAVPPAPVRAPILWPFRGPPEQRRPAPAEDEAGFPRGGCHTHPDGRVHCLPL